MPDSRRCRLQLRMAPSLGGRNGRLQKTAAAAAERAAAGPSLDRSRLRPRRREIRRRRRCRRQGTRPRPQVKTVSSTYCVACHVAWLLWTECSLAAQEALACLSVATPVLRHHPHPSGMSKARCNSSVQRTSWDTAETVAHLSMLILQSPSLQAAAGRRVGWNPGMRRPQQARDLRGSAAAAATPSCFRRPCCDRAPSCLTPTVSGPAETPT